MDGGYSEKLVDVTVWFRWVEEMKAKGGGGGGGSNVGLCGGARG